MTHLLAFIILLGVLIFVHELGHFLVARLFKIRVEIFSIGFGPSLVSWKRKDTEYRISAIPLGGYVKLFGEEPSAEISPELARFSFLHQRPLKRALVVAAGPFSNLFLPLAILVGIYLVGYPELAPVIGRVRPGYEAFKAGLLAGDKILAVDGEKVNTWEEMSAKIKGKINEQVDLLVERDNWRFSVKVKTVEGESFDVFGEPKKVGLIGIRPDAYTSVIGVSDVFGAAYVAGLRTGDEIVEVNGQRIKYFFELEKKIWASPDESLLLKVKRGEQELEIELKPKAKLADEKCRWYAKEKLCGEVDVEPAVFYIKKVLPDSPALEAGFKAGDRVFSVDGEPIWEIEDFMESVQKRAGQALKIVVLREGKPVELTVVPKAEQTTDFVGRVETVGKIGVEFYPALDTGFEQIVRYGPFKAFLSGIETTARWTKITLEAFYRIIIGKISVRTVGGPIMIAKLAGDAASLGFLPYLFLMALISLNLFVINLFPVPALDGGMLIVLAIEAIRKKPLSRKVMEIYQRVGFALLIALVILIFYNDISRYKFAIGKAIKGAFK